MKLIIYGDIGGSGGYVRYCKGLLGSNSIPADVEVWFISSLPFYEQLTPLDPQIHIITHPWLISKNRLNRYLWYLVKYPLLLRKIKPDVEFYPTGQLRVYLRKALTVATCHNLLLFDKKELERINNEKEYKYFLKYRDNQAASFLKSNALIFLSKYSQELVSRQLSAIKQSTIISHGLDSVFLSKEMRSYEFSGTIKLLYVSPNYHYKHQVEVVKCVQILRNSTGFDIQVNLIGGGKSSYSSELKNYVQKEKVQSFVFVNENINYKELLKEYKDADIFIFASSCETFGITLLEAMGSRLPIACSNRTGLSEILKDAGVYFDPEDPESMADSVRKLIVSIELRKTLAEKAYQYAVDYPWERCASETFQYIKKIGAINEK
ncbi:MAG: glycosyltransferase family 1 protein [Ginsengibacter sp.]